MTPKTRADLAHTLTIWLLLFACYVIAPELWHTLVGLGIILTTIRAVEWVQRP